jgi:hypothetical protein
VSDTPYRVQPPRPPAPPDPYLVAWRDLRKRRATLIVFFLLWLPIGGASSCLLRDREFYALVPLAALVVTSYLRAVLFHCPECRQMFHFQGFGSRGSPWARRCVHCGIAMGTPKNDSAPDVLL